MGRDEVIWWVITVCVCFCALGALVNHIKLRSHIRDMQIGREEEKRDRASRKPVRRE